jgi:RimJ/RimL family protein N-acetyltransferase
MIDFKFQECQTDFGYVLSKRYWNQGIMTEAMQPVIRYVYDLSNIYRIWATHDIDNIGSGKVMEKLGMQYEGTLRRSLIHPNISNIPRDGKYYSIVK